jgi:hypothetical protein
MPQPEDLVVVISNDEDAWIETSATMGEDLAAALGVSSSEVIAVNSETFINTWNTITAKYVIIHTHGKPSTLQGYGFVFDVADGSLLRENPNIQLVVMTACQTGGSNGGQMNVGQLLSKKIAANGHVICSTTKVDGDDKTFFAKDGGKWVVYQNGTHIASLFDNPITMGSAAFNPFGWVGGSL